MKTLFKDKVFGSLQQKSNQLFVLNVFVLFCVCLEVRKHTQSTRIYTIFNTCSDLESNVCVCC